MNDLICIEIFNKWVLHLATELKKKKHNCGAEIKTPISCPAATCSMDSHEKCYKSVHLLLFQTSLHRELLAEAQTLGTQTCVTAVCAGWMGPYLSFQALMSDFLTEVILSLSHGPNSTFNMTSCMQFPNYSKLGITYYEPRKNAQWCEIIIAIWHLLKTHTLW